MKKPKLINPCCHFCHISVSGSLAIANKDQGLIFLCPSSFNRLILILQTGALCDPVDIQEVDTNG